MQFALTPVPPRPAPPAWIEELGKWVIAALRPVGRFFAWLFSFLPDAPWARLLFYGLIAAGVVLLLWLIVARVRGGTWRWRKRGEQVDVAAVEGPEWQPEAAPARAWLEEADALASQGRFAEALHCLLLRSVDDMARRRPRAVRPALTTRELALSPLVPERARGLFARLAEGVERSLFGRRAIAPAEWADARAAYAEYALAGTWRA